MLKGTQRGYRAAQGADLNDAQPARHRPRCVLAVTGRREENGGARGASGCHLLLDPAYRQDGAVGLNLPGSRDELAASQIRRGDLVDDREREHQAGARAADLADVDRHLEGEHERLSNVDPDDWLTPVALSPEGNVARLALLADRQLDPAAGRTRLDQGRCGVVTGHWLAVDRPDDVTAPKVPGGWQALDRACDPVVRRESQAELAQRCRLGRLLRVGHLLRVLLDHLLGRLPGREKLLLRDDRIVRAQPRLQGGQ